MCSGRTVRWLRRVPFWLIIPLCTLAGILGALLVSWHTILPARPVPAALPTLPINAIAIRSIDTPSFFRADPHIQTADGQVYHLVWEQGAYTWKLDSSPGAAEPGGACTPKNIELIEASAAPIVDCQGVRTVGEWCPGPFVSIAVTERGDVWELTEEPVCLFIFGMVASVFAPAGFALGVVIVVLRRIILFVVRSKV